VRPSVARMMAKPWKPRARVPRPTPLGGPGVAPPSMRDALYRAKVCLEEQLVELQGDPPTNRYYENVERICGALNVIYAALGEA
jgi:hypothetical protein